MKYGSVCSGIEAASVAWESLGWQPAWFAEIEPFPAAVLAHHWPQVKNLGDMTKIAAGVLADQIEAPDVLVGGTPCQAFSVAGLRNGLADERGQLTLSYVELANAIDDKRCQRGERESIIVWENVPGVLNSKDNAFGCFLAGLAGESSALQPPGGKWTLAGCVRGPARNIAWRVLDAQFFGVAQRRRRVFVIASARDDIDPAKILFESDGVRRDTPPRRESQTAVAALTAHGVGACGADDNQAQAGHLIPEISAYRMTAFGEYADDETASTVKARDYKDATDLAVMTVHGTQDPDVNIELAHTLGRNNGQENACIAFSYKDHGQDAGYEIAPTLRAGNCDTGRGNSGQPPAVAKAMLVRRLTPRECERLQGFPDDHTKIPWRNKLTEDCPDGARYKAIGNSMAVPVMRWIGEQIKRATATQEIICNPYVAAVDKLRAQNEHYLREVGDQWRTPDLLFWGINAIFGPLVLDLFTDGDNSKCPNYYTAEQNALTQDWSARLADLGGAAFANPPYSRSQYHDGQAITGMAHIMSHARSMRDAGGRFVFLLKAAPSETWWPEDADHVTFIRGRVGFDLPAWFNPADEKQAPSSANFAAAIVVLDKNWRGGRFGYIHRTELEAKGRAALALARYAVNEAIF
ncbi:TPA: phage N-6-adenine-methyltransferase [Escherichia coli]